MSSRQIQLLLLPIILLVGPTLLGWLVVMYYKKIRVRKLVSIGIIFNAIIVSTILIFAIKKFDFQQLLKILLLMIYLDTPALLGLLAAYGIQKLPSRIHLVAEVIVVILAVTASLRWAMKVEDGWGLFLIGWPLSGVLVFGIMRYLIRRKALTKSPIDRG